jgi:hypothetical protein
MNNETPIRETILDDTLEIKTDYNFPQFNPKYFFNESKGFEPVTVIENTQITHKNYLDYLVLCWRSHYGVVISPTILWNLVLCNMAYMVNKRPETFRKYFTDSDKKKEIIVEQGGNLISTELLVDMLKGYMSTKVMDTMFPVFTTDTEKSIIANQAAFLDMVSPYYNYGMLLCGIPKIKILGTKTDWLTFMFNLGSIASVLPEFAEYSLTVGDKVSRIIDDIIDYKGMFNLEKCGLGSQVMVSGWIQDFFIEQPKVPYPENFISCVSKIDYKCYNDNKEYRLYAGLFTSERTEDGYLIPTFDNMYFVKTENEVKPAANTVTIETETKTVKGGILKGWDDTLLPGRA